MPRLNKRGQRELEEFTHWQERKHGDASDDSEIDSLPPNGGRITSGFAALLVGEESEGDDASDAKSAKAPKNKKKKKKKKHAESPVSALSTPGADAKVSHYRAVPVTSAKSEKKALKKAKAKEKRAADEELDKAIAELSKQYPASQQISQAGSPGRTLAELLSVSLQNLDGDAEMRKLFGSRVIQANSATGTPSSSSRKRLANVRSNLTRPKPTWWAAQQREGLSIYSLPAEEIEKKLQRHAWKPTEEKWWSVEYSKRYKSMTMAFMKTVMSGEPQGFWDLLRRLPWHADNLLQISEVYRHREEFAQAVDFVDRALFTYERSFIGAFNFTTGINRLDFDRVQNRPFFLAVHRQIADLQRRGCVRTAFEFSRLLYALDPWDDPHGALFHVDFLAIKAGMGRWLIDVYDVFSSSSSDSQHDTRLDPTLLPGWAYARALSMWIDEESQNDKEHSGSTAALKEAVIDFPSVVPLLADKIDAVLPPSIRGHENFKIHTDASSLSPSETTLHLLSHLYVQRSSTVWKGHSDWFSTTVTQCFSDHLPPVIVSLRRQRFFKMYESENVRFSVYRHVMVLEASYHRLFSFIPRSVLDLKSIACDPLPPLTSVSHYDEEFFQGVEELFSVGEPSSQEPQPDQLLLLQEVFNAYPNFAEIFPGGMRQFAQIAVQLPLDDLQALLLQGMGENGVRAQGMPGELIGFEDVPININDNVHNAADEVRIPMQNIESSEDEDHEGGVEDGEEIGQPFPRIIRNILGRFWSWNAPTNEESSASDDEMMVRDDTGVD